MLIVNMYLLYAIKQHSYYSKLTIDAFIIIRNKDKFDQSNNKIHNSKNLVSLVFWIINNYTNSKNFNFNFYDKYAD